MKKITKKIPLRYSSALAGISIAALFTVLQLDAQLKSQSAQVSSSTSVLTCSDNDRTDDIYYRGSVQLAGGKILDDYCEDAFLYQYSCTAQGDSTFLYAYTKTTCVRGCKRGRCRTPIQTTGTSAALDAARAQISTARKLTAEELENGFTPIRKKKAAKVSTAVMNTDTQSRICKRVEKRFGENPRMLRKINERLQKRYSWQCNIETE